MPLDAPLPLGPFVVMTDGRLCPGSPAIIPAFRVRWRDRTIHVRLLSAADDRNPAVDRPGTSAAADPGTLALQVKLGRVPSTAGGDAAERQAARAQLFAMLPCLPALLPIGWQIVISPDHCVGLEAGFAIPVPASVAALITRVTLFLLELAPYLDVLDEAGIGIGTAA